METLIAFVSTNFVLCIVFVCILILLALIIGYLIGNNILNRHNDEYIDSEIGALKYEVSFRTSIIDNVNLGVIAYNENGKVYQNQQITRLKEFLPSNENGGKFPVPETIEEFLNRYDHNNHLKSKYLLNVSNSNSESRANYQTEHRVFEIRILHRFHEQNVLDIVIVDDITELQDYERRQKDIAANVSHELKTPLTILRASEFFINGITPEKMPSYQELKKWGNRIVVNSVRMEDMVQNLLYLSMCAQQVPMQIIEVKDIIDKALSDVSDYPNRDRVEIVTPTSYGYPLIYGNTRLLTLVVKNLLTNAIKYIDYEGKTEPHRIVIEIADVDNGIGIQVSDNGRGIPEKATKDLFERFYRVDNSGSHDVGGTGIGLSIVKEVADMHEGKIYVDSTLGEGSTFTLMLSKAEEVFSVVYEDSKSGVISEKQYLKSAAEFIALHAIEAVRSMGYEDAVLEANAFENAPENDVKIHDDALTGLLVKLGDARYRDLVEELTFVEEFDDEFEDDYDEDFEDFEEEPISAPEAIPTESILNDKHVKIYTNADFEDFPQKASDILQMAEEEKIKQQKEEARRLLTQQILPRASQIKAQEEVEAEKIKENKPAKPKETGITSSKNAKKVSPIINKTDKNSSDSKLIHPNSGIKLYNGSSKKSARKKKAPADTVVKAESSNSNEPERQSAMKQVLDSTVPIKPIMRKDEGEQ